MAEFKKFIAVLLSVVISGTVLTAGTLKILYTQSQQIAQSDTANEASNHFSVQWMGFAPTDYGSDYPEYYICINNLKDDPLTMQIALQIKNQEDSGYYFKIDQFAVPPSGWSVLPMAVGFVDVDQTKQFVYDNVFRSRPTSIAQGRLTESISLVVQAYYDPGCTNLYSQDDFTVTFNFLDLTSLAWTTLYHDDFDDGTTQGWSSVLEGSRNYGDGIVASDTYYRSFQYSLRLYTYTRYNTYGSWCRTGYQKSFDIGLTSEVYLIYSLRSENWVAHDERGVQINGITYFKSDVTPEANIWYQFAVKLKPAEANQVTIWMTYLGNVNADVYSYLDDVYVIAK